MENQNRKQNQSVIGPYTGTLSEKVQGLCVLIGWDAAEAMDHNSFYALYSKTYAEAPLRRSIERILRRKVRQHWLKKRA